jgi:hypothetical protein
MVLETGFYLQGNELHGDDGWTRGYRHFRISTIMAGALTAKYKKFFPANAEDVFIETGTYRGNSILRALGFGFKELHTIEVSAQRFNQLETVHPDICQNANVHRYLGSSRDMLASIIPQFKDRNTVFWLDAHYQGLTPDERDSVSECPILNELQAIADIQWSQSVVVCIDDFNMFKGGANVNVFTFADWPHESQLMDIMHSWKSSDDSDNIVCFYR